MADAMASNGMKELGYEYINLDGKNLKITRIAFFITTCIYLHRLLG